MHAPRPAVAENLAQLVCLPPRDTVCMQSTTINTQSCRARTQACSGGELGPVCSARNIQEPGQKTCRAVHLLTKQHQQRAPRPAVAENFAQLVARASHSRLSLRNTSTVVPACCSALARMTAPWATLLRGSTAALMFFRICGGQRTRENGAVGGVAVLQQAEASRGSSGTMTFLRNLYAGQITCFIDER